MKKKDEQLGEAAYNAYCAAQKEALPKWSELSDELKKSWIAAAQAVVDMHQSFTKSTYVGQ